MRVRNLCSEMAAAGPQAPIAIFFTHPRFGIKHSGSMPRFLIFFCRSITLTFDRQDMQQLRPLDLFQILQHAGQLPHIVSVDRTEIPKM